jgi:hypothetical protein
MPRGSNKQSAVFKAVLDTAKKQLHLASDHATAFRHSGIRGDERAAAVAQFFRDHLPSTIGVSKGEAIDYADNRTGQLDIVIYDADMAAPISSQAENVLIPAESLLAVIEVKTLLSQDELNKCYAAAAKIRQLRPFKEHFVSARDQGRAATDGTHRCLYVVFAFETNISQKDWLQAEYKRIKTAAIKPHRLSLVDAVIVLDRGMVRPGPGVGKTNDGNEVDTFLEFYLHVVNFIRREQPRRPLMDWQAYTTKKSKGWTLLTKSPSTSSKGPTVPSNVENVEQHDGLSHQTDGQQPASP